MSGCGRVDSRLGLGVRDERASSLGYQAVPSSRRTGCSLPHGCCLGGAVMSKPEFANVCVGTLLDNTDTGFRYRIHERICRTLVLVRVTPFAGLPLVITVRIGQRAEWNIAEVQY